MLLNESLALENGDGSSFSCLWWVGHGVNRATGTHYRFLSQFQARHKSLRVES
jgi:hypothetical protein